MALKCAEELRKLPKDSLRLKQTTSMFFFFFQIYVVKIIYHYLGVNYTLIIYTTFTRHLGFIGMIYGFMTSHYTVLLWVSTALSSITNSFTAEKKITELLVSLTI